jgi:hypothetical protein
MTKPFIRAAAFAALSLILLAVTSTIVFLFLIGVPKGPEALSTFQTQAAQMAPQVDLVLGGLILLLCGWLAARPFAGNAAIKTAALVALIYLLLDFGIILLFGNVRQVALESTGLSYAVKTAGALIGGWIAARAPVPMQVPIDQE